MQERVVQPHGKFPVPGQLVSHTPQVSTAIHIKDVHGGDDED